jgi:hypothetical protein
MLRERIHWPTLVFVPLFVLSILLWCRAHVSGPEGMARPAAGADGTHERSMAVGPLLPEYVEAGEEANQEPGNCLEGYFRNADVWYREEEERETIAQALQDMLTLPPARLKERRYDVHGCAGGAGGPCDLPALIERHVLPDKKSKSLGKHFYKDIKSKKVKAEVRKLLEAVEGEADGKL